MSVHVTCVVPPLSPALREALVPLYLDVFQGDPDELAHLERQPGSRLWLAWDGPDVVGFKWATVRRPGELYSNLGLVAPTHRRRGIARQLLREQHAWAAANGFRSVSTNTYQHYLPMLLLNLEEGCELVGVHANRRGLKLLLVRDLSTGGPLLPGKPAREARDRHTLAASLRAGHTIVGLRWDGAPVVLLEEDDERT